MTYLMLASIMTLATASACLVGLRYAVEYQRYRDRRDRNQ